MRLPALINLAGIVRAFAKGQEIIVLGSSSLLATFPGLGEPGNLLESSFDADLLLSGCDEILAQILDESVGAESLFERQHGYHADILRPAIVDLLPKNWRERLIPLPGCPGVFCLEPHDLAVAKLQAGRPKDLALLGALLSSGRLVQETIRERIDATVLSDKMVVSVFQKLKEAVEQS